MHGAGIFSLVLVATRGLQDGEELFLNYRLSPGKRPDWYRAVDAEEDVRRWA